MVVLRLLNHDDAQHYLNNLSRSRPCIQCALHNDAPGTYRRLEYSLDEKQAEHLIRQFADKQFGCCEPFRFVPKDDKIRLFTGY